MAKSKETFSKKDKEKKRLKKRKEKQMKRDERKGMEKRSMDDMISYVDEQGNFSDTPPDPALKEKVDVSTILIGIPKKEDIEVELIRQGKVEFFNDEKGFGFIRDLEDQEKYFVHIKEVDGDFLAENEKVQFEIEHGLKGLNAVRVKKL